MTAPRPGPQYVPPAAPGGHIRVTLTNELPWNGFSSTVRFLGTFQDQAVAVEVYDVTEIIPIRRALGEHGSAIFDSLSYRVYLATQQQIESVRALEPQEAEDLIEVLESIAVTSALGDDLASLNERARTELG